ncbi:GBS Bsp-like repeat-containing protein [Streptococcus dysgalactiae]|uniref:GBS Bsp-like repeat-containing protein n=1 Tax=Streptococcus dysgalactiae TaxID=1334 RepID=UPI001C4CFA0F|nr:C39 family peptidase [Streptococcus dysgalactiae]
MRKRMYKVKKRWVVASASTLAIVGFGGSAAFADTSIETKLTGQPLLASVSKEQELQVIEENGPKEDNLVVEDASSQKNEEERDLVDTSSKEAPETNLVMPRAVQSQALTMQSTIEKPNLSYRSHVQNIGWQEAVGDSEVSGTVTNTNQVEAVSIQVDNPSGLSGQVLYSTLVRGQGWGSSVADGQVSGTVGKSTPVEAIKIQLTGDLQQRFDVYYRVNVKDLGWMNWTSNGLAAGAEGLGTYLQAYEVKLLKKGEKFYFNPQSTLNQPNLQYQTFIEKTGWQTPVVAGQTSGTVGQSKQIEGLKIQLSDTSAGHLIYQTHVQDYGWLQEVTNNTVSGAVNQAKQVEAFKIRLTGKLAKQFDVVYRAHVQDIGWQAWVQNGALAGTVGKAKQVEALEIKLIAKASQAPSQYQEAFLKFTKPELTYRAYVENGGWQAFVSDGATSGTLGQSKQMEGMRLALTSTAFGDIVYKTHVQDIGWLPAVSTGNDSGVPHQHKQIEAFQIALTGLLAQKYDIYYRAHVQDIGWQGWRRNNSIAGTVGQSKQVEAFEVKLVEKPKKTIAMVQNHQPNQGRLDVLVLQGTEVKVIRSVKVVAWSQADQSNRFVYQTNRVIDGEAQISVDQANHNYLAGDYIVQAYITYIDQSEEQIPVGTYRLAAQKRTYQTPYYSQRDQRWAGKWYGLGSFGETGCAPTSLAMVFSALSGATVLPTQVGDFLYQNTVEFNRGFLGTSSRGLLMATKAFGYQADVLGSFDALVNALKSGEHVIGVVQKNIFVKSGTHDMVFKGYDNGKTYVYDPYTRELSGWYPVSNLWHEQSTDSIDTRGVVAPFFKITKA